jgi:hypothetical protein
MTLDVLPYNGYAIDLLDRVLDKGIVIDAWLRVAVAGIDLVTVEARVVVASIDTYLANATTVARTAPIARPVATPARRPDHIHEQLHHVLEQFDQRRFGRQQIRRLEDRVRQDRRDAHARTISHGRQLKAVPPRPRA